MALVRFGNGVTEMRGSIAGTTFSRVRGGAIARNRTVPVNPNTLKQADVRSQFAMIVAAWNSVSKNDIDGWNSFATGVELVNRLGEAYTPSGRQVFLSINLAKQFAGLALLTEAPSSPNLPDPDAGITDLTIEATGPAGINLVTFDTNVLTAQASTNVFFDATPPLENGQTNVENLYRRIAVFTPTAAAENLLGAYQAAFPEVAPSSTSMIDKVVRWRYRITTAANPLLSAYNYGSNQVGTA